GSRQGRRPKPGRPPPTGRLVRAPSASSRSDAHAEVTGPGDESGRDLAANVNVPARTVTFCTRRTRFVPVTPYVWNSLLVPRRGPSLSHDWYAVRIGFNPKSMRSNGDAKWFRLASALAGPSAVNYGANKNLLSTSMSSTLRSTLNSAQSAQTAGNITSAKS